MTSRVHWGSSSELNEGKGKSDYSSSLSSDVCAEVDVKALTV